MKHNAAAGLAGLILTGACVCHAETPATVTAEYGELRDGQWRFPTLAGPSRSDAAQGATVHVVAGALHRDGAPAAGLTDGVVSATGGDPSQAVFFDNACRTGGSFVLDLGQVLAIRQVGSYSWHEWNVDHGARTPQVYTLYGSAVDAPDPADPAAWTRLAEVDSRPNRTGEQWGNRPQAVRIAAPDGKDLGRFRRLLWVVRPTDSPLTVPRQGGETWCNTFFTELDVHTSATLDKAGDAVLAQPAEVDHVWVVFKTHFDLGYTDLATNVFRRYREEMMDGALKVIDESRALPPEQRFAWTIAGWPLEAQILGPLQDPARRKRVERAVAEGALVVHALPATLHTESLDLEDLVRSLGFSSRVARRFDLPLPISGKMTDVPEHSWVLPTLLAHAGIKFLQLGCNSACQYPRFPRLFWWEGPDGSRVLCNYTVDYGSALTPPRDWPSKHYLAMIMTGDNHGPPTPPEVARVRAELAAKLPRARVTIGTLDDFAKAVLAENPTLPVVRGDTPDTWIHGLLSMPAATRVARNIRPLEPVLDALDTELRAWGLAPAPLAPALAEAYANSFLYGEHTWGMNGAYGGRLIWGLEEWQRQLPPDRQAKFLKSFDDHRDYIRRTETIVSRELQSRLALLAGAVKTDGARLVVWNGLPWPRSGLVEVPGQPGQTLLAEDVPASGYRTYPLPPPSPSELPALSDPPIALDTPFFRVTFDLQRGGIASLIEKRTGRELADRASPYALGQFLHERFSKREVDRFFKAYSRMPGGWALDDLGKPGMPESGAVTPTLSNVHATAPGQPNPGAMGKPGLPDADKAPYLAVSPGNWRILIDRGPAADSVTLTAGDTRGLAQAFSLLFTFPRHAPYVEVAWTVTGKTPDKLPEGGWLCFPFAVAQPRFTVGRPGGAIDPARDVVPGANRHLYAVASGVAIAGADGSGASVCPLDSPLVSLERPGLWWWSMDFEPKTPTVFVNLYNNKWNTNFPLWIDGSWSARVRFWPGADLVGPAWEARVPLLAAAADGAGGRLPATQAGLRLSRPGVLVTAFGGNPDGAGTLLRVWDQGGKAGELAVTLPEGFTVATATPVDLRGTQAGKPIPVKRGQFAFPLGAYAPASFTLE